MCAEDEPSLALSVKSFINRDMSVDAELRISNLPLLWRTRDGKPELVSFFSEKVARLGILAPGEEGGRYYIICGLRFGPQSQSQIEELAELYKRFRGLFQLTVHPTDAGYPSGLQNNLVGMGILIETVFDRRGSPPAVILIRLTWMPDGSRPGRYPGEDGRKKLATV